MVTRPLWIAIVVGVFFVGMASSYAIFSETYDPASMKFANQEKFDQMMTNNPKMVQHWTSMQPNSQQKMGDMMQTGMQGHDDAKKHESMHDKIMNGVSDPVMKQQILDEMQRHHENMFDLIEHAIDDPELKQQLQEKIQKHMDKSSSPKQATSLVTNSDFTISASELKQQMTLDPNLVVIDMRDQNSYMNGHIDSSSVDVMEGATLEKRINTMFSRIPEVTANIHVVLVGDSESLALDSAQIMNDAGIKASYLIGGIESWNDNLSTKITPTLISSEELYQQLQNQDDIYLLDVREPSELEVTMISGSKNIPLADIFIEENLSEIPTDKPVVIICGSGNRATIATYELAQHGVDFQVLEGGMKAWDAYIEENDLPQI